MWKNRKKRKIRKKNKREQVSSEIHIEDFKLLINGEPVPATKFVLTEKFIYGAWDSEKIPKMDITVEITLKKEDCVGICGFCEIKDTCDNPKRQAQKDKVKKRLQDSDGSEKIKHDGIITRRKIEASGGEKDEWDILHKNKITMREKLNAPDLKPPEPRCGICKYELSLIEDVPCNSCNMYELDKFEPREDENHES